MEKILVPIKAESDVALVRQEASKFALSLGFDDYASAQVALGVSEIAQNVIRYAEQGEALIYGKTNNRVLQIEITDQGKGFENIQQARQEGFSTSPNSFGLGISVAENIFDKVSINSIPNQGSTVVLEKWLPLPSDLIAYGSVCINDERYLLNGDATFIKEFDGNKILLVVIDGIGQGESAHAMSHFILKILEQHFSLPLDQLAILCDEELKESEHEGGAAIALALLSPDKLEYLGIGDTHTYLYNSTISTLRNQDGRIGTHHLPKLKIRDYSITEHTHIILCTDGINTHIPEGLPKRPIDPQPLANSIFNSYHRLYGDATVLVAYYQPGEL